METGERQSVGHALYNACYGAYCGAFELVHGSHVWLG